jgi:putative oxidoreductase
MLNRPLPPPARDALLLLTRVLLGVVMFAHGYQKMIINGIGRTTDGFERMDIPAAIVSASFVTVVEFAGSVLLLAGAATTLVCGLMGVIMVGAGIFVHIPNGIFLANKGWELVGVIGVGLLFLMAAGPGRYSVDHLVRGVAARHRERLAPAPG